MKKQEIDTNCDEHCPCADLRGWVCNKDPGLTPDLGCPNLTFSMVFGCLSLRIAADT